MKGIVLSAALCASGWLVHAEPSAIAIRNARVVTGTGQIIERGMVVVRRGLIESASAATAPPADAWVIDGSGLSVYPGLIDALSTWGLPASARATPSAPTAPARTVRAPSTTPAARGPEDRPANTSWLRAQDVILPAEKIIVDAREAGFTTAAVFPAAGIFAGHGAAINLAGAKAGDMVVAPSIGLYHSLAPTNAGFPGSLLGVIAYIRQVYLDAEHYRTAQSAYRLNSRVPRPAYDRAIEGLLDTPRALLPATTDVEIDRIIRFAAELKLPAVLYGMHEGFRVTDKIKSSGVPVLINLKWPERDSEADPEQQDSLKTLELREHAPSTPAALVKTGVKFAFYSGGVDKPADLRKAVKRAIDAGLTTADALRALTLSPAEIYGIADRLGSIEPGKIANLVVTDGDLFDSATRIKYVFVDGVKYEPAPRAASDEEEKS